MPRWRGKGRRSIRLPGYDYASPGYYFVTICVQRGSPSLGRVVDGVVRLNHYGRIVDDAWVDLPNHHDNVDLDVFVIMSNHIHGIIIINDVGAGSEPAPTDRSSKRHGLPEIIRGFKTFSARRINQARQTPGRRFWQRNYYEHIIRNQDALDRIRQYIQNNPRKIR
jgi:putative transposase